MALTICNLRKVTSSQMSHPSNREKYTSQSDIEGPLDHYTQKLVGMKVQSALYSRML